ncbi:hypothetical protein Q669_00530 [Labrenzia sp. C1B10]|nr:hypothetical protein Q669_00530 [Labrenzia sp. C1B10]ERS00954.1 hypothetical protein Q675_09110 [Labrenzia sp. C1B70]
MSTQHFATHVKKVADLTVLNAVLGTPRMAIQPLIQPLRKLDTI